MSIHIVEFSKRELDGWVKDNGLQDVLLEGRNGNSWSLTARKL